MLPQKKGRAKRICRLLLYFIPFVGGIFVNNIAQPWGAIGLASCSVTAAALYIAGGGND